MHLQFWIFERNIVSSMRSSRSDRLLSMCHTSLDVNKYRQSLYNTKQSLNVTALFRQVEDSWKDRQVRQTVSLSMGHGMHIKKSILDICFRDFITNIK